MLEQLKVDLVSLANDIHTLKKIEYKIEKVNANGYFLEEIRKNRQYLECLRDNIINIEKELNELDSLSELPKEVSGIQKDLQKTSDYFSDVFEDLGYIAKPFKMTKDLYTFGKEKNVVNFFNSSSSILEFIDEGRKIEKWSDYLIEDLKPDYSTVLGETKLGKVAKILSITADWHENLEENNGDSWRATVETSVEFGVDWLLDIPIVGPTVNWASEEMFGKDPGELLVDGAFGYGEHLAEKYEEEIAMVTTNVLDFYDDVNENISNFAQGVNRKFNNFKQNTATWISSIF